MNFVLKYANRRSSRAIKKFNLLVGNILAIELLENTINECTNVRKYFRF